MEEGGDIHKTKWKEIKIDVDKFSSGWDDTKVFQLSRATSSKNDHFND